MNRVRKALDCPGEAREDWRIVCAMADALGGVVAGLRVAGGRLERARRPLPELVRDPLPAARGARDPVAVHRPRPSRARRTSTRRSRRCPGGRGRFFPVEYQPPIEPTDSEYPFVLSTGRTLYHYNSATMTMREAGVVEKQEQPFFEINAEDARRARHRRRRARAARLPARRARGARALLGARLPGARLDGAPLRAGEGELAPPRRRRPADRYAGVQGLGGPGRSASDARGLLRRGGRRPLRRRHWPCSTRPWSTRPSTSSPSWPATGRRSSSGSAPAGSRCRSPTRGVRVAGIDLSEAMVARLRAKPGAEEIEVTIGDFATTTRRRHVLARLPRLQHDRQPDDAGRAGRLLPERRRPPRARRLLRDRARRLGQRGEALEVFDLSDTHVGDRRVRRRHPAARLASLHASSTAAGSGTRCRSGRCGPASST